MTDIKYDRRLTALRTWRAAAAAAGHTVPADIELTDIAANPKYWTEKIVSRICHDWADTINHLLHQIQFGVDPWIAVEQLPEELAHPANPPTAGDSNPQSTAGHTDHQSALSDPAAPDPRTAIVAELMGWRTTQIGDNVEGADLIKDATLRNLVKFNHNAAEVIAKKLPGPAAHLAPQIAAIMAGGASTAPNPPTANETTVPSVRYQPENAAPPAPSMPPTPAPPAAAQSEVGPPGRHSRAEATTLNLSHHDFCEYAYDDSSITPTTITITPTATGVQLTYDPFVGSAGQTVIYRVVSGEDCSPYKPEAGDLVAVTTGTHVEDDRFMTSAVRAYQVWCHIGSDVHTARHAQPFLLAEGAEVSPVEDFAISEDEGRIIGEWSVFPGTRAVRVYRIPLSSVSGAGNDPRNQICTGQPNLTGFVDNDAVRGARYLYRAIAEVVVADAVRLSRTRQQEILVSVVLHGIDDLTIDVGGSHTEQVNLRWTTPPVGQVRIYRLSSPPPAGFDGSELPEAALEPQGFTDATRIKHPVTAADPTHSQMVGVPWPAAWTRTYMTPVTVLDGQARIGITRVKTRPLPPVTGAEIIERYHTQIARFGWPNGAAAVLAFVGSSSLTPEEICAGNQPQHEINKRRYERDGGLPFSSPLSSKGCTVCLVPVNYSAGEQIRGAITSVQYPGLMRVVYGLQDARVPERSVMEIWLRSEHDVEAPPPLMMLNNPERFPLGTTDGQFVPIKLGDGQAVPQAVLDRIPKGAHPTGCTVDLTEVYGYIRLFLAPTIVSETPIALADPDIQKLWHAPAPRVGP